MSGEMNPRQPTAPFRDGVRRAVLRVRPGARYRAYESHLRQVEDDWAELMDSSASARSGSGDGSASRPPSAGSS
jgi:hypothetical protein